MGRSPAASASGPKSPGKTSSPAACGGLSRATSAFRGSLGDDLALLPDILLRRFGGLHRTARDRSLLPAPGDSATPACGGGRSRQERGQEVRWPTRHGQQPGRPATLRSGGLRGSLAAEILDRRLVYGYPRVAVSEEEALVRAAESGSHY